MVKSKKIKIISFALAIVAFVTIVCGTTTFARFYRDYEEKNHVRVAEAVAKLKTDSMYRTDKNGVRESVAFDSEGKSALIKDVEPQDVIDYYFTVSGADGQRKNEVSMNVTLDITVRLEMIFAGESGVKRYYFAGWAAYTKDDGLKSGGSLEIYSGAEGENQSHIRPSSGSGSSDVDFTGNRLSVIESADGTIVNKAGLVMSAADDKKDHPYHIRFTLPEQSAETESYAGAKVFFDIRTVAEQIEK